MISAGHPQPRNGWFKSSFSNGSGSCVEVNFDHDAVSIRDSKYLRDPTNDPAHQPIITVTPEQWATFLDEVAGRAEACAATALSVDTTTARITVLRSTTTDVALTFTAAEWDAFLSGARAREFDHPAATLIA